MDYQTQMNGNGAGEPPARKVAHSAAELWHHILMLGELQARLAALELAEGIRRAKSGVILLAAGLLIVLVTLPVLLVSVALVLVDEAGMIPAHAFSLVTGVSLLVAAGLVAGGLQRLKGHAADLPLSRRELKANWGWLKESARQARAGGTAPSDIRRSMRVGASHGEAIH